VRRIAFLYQYFFEHFKTKVTKENEEKMTKISQKQPNNHKSIKLVQDTPK
jgi:hypothetical protein